MKPIDYTWLEEYAGHYFMDNVRSYLMRPVWNYQFEITTAEGEKYNVLRVLDVAGDYHVFVQRYGELIVSTNSMSSYDLDMLQELRRTPKN